jgi:hypothetical protein
MDDISVSPSQLAYILLRQKFTWIPVAERLPEEGEDVLVWLPEFSRTSVASVYSDVSSRHWWKGEEEFFKGDCGVLVGDDDAPSHWMPLPDPPPN